MPFCTNKPEQTLENERVERFRTIKISFHHCSVVTNSGTKLIFMMDVSEVEVDCVGGVIRMST